MINFESFRLNNGLRVHVIPDPSVRTAVLNIAYDVGSRDEDEDKTGFAHLFEHLMFGGSANIPEYDSPLQKVGGENNAFTTPDYTNYYLTLPSNNIETGFWLESDRMLNLSFDPRVLEVQRKVVIEEFKQRYLNRPYGDVWHKLRPLAYKKHPYRWPVIGETIQHIEEATMDDVRSFFNRHYTPDNAVLTVAGDVELNQVQDLAEKWFGPVNKSSEYKRNLPQESVPSDSEFLEYHTDVPQDALYKVFPMPGRMDKGYYAVDLLSDLLGRGKSSRLHKKMVKELGLFTSLGASVMGTSDPGLFVIQGMVKNGVDAAEADSALNEFLEDIVSIQEEEYQKVKNQALSTLAFAQADILEQATELSLFTLMGQPNHINEQASQIEAVTKADIDSAAKRILDKSFSSTLHYLKKK